MKGHRGKMGVKGQLVLKLVLKLVLRLVLKQVFETGFVSSFETGLGGLEKVMVGKV